ncbi:glycoside hydrolase [Pedobacter sp. HMF7647]|uniref:Glycoside hydrolase n=1 Tax=Hufsiella arboris TaxID=2695275 RepID=A0A7K1YCE9_9SPHI|nr:glycoside hydrolase [Hufsiella arboris]
MRSIKIITVVLCSMEVAVAQQHITSFTLNSQEYLENGGVNVMLAHDFYPEGHQGGVGIIQQGQRVATNGDLRLEPTPGQWSPTPKVGKRVVNKGSREVSVRMEYPNQEVNRKGFNPIIYPDLNFAYTLRIQPAGESFKIIVDLDKPLPASWENKVGFNIELFPGILFGKSYYMDNQPGIFSRQPNNQLYKDESGEDQVKPMAMGRTLMVSPESPAQQLIIKNIGEGNLELLDGRARHNNGWFVVRSLVKKGASKKAIEWLVTPNAVQNWQRKPVIQVSQIGYHPSQQKIAIVELDKKDLKRYPATLLRLSEKGGFEKVTALKGKDWGDFLRYHYLQLDFSNVTQKGMYLISYGSYRSNPFSISPDIYKENVWQPTIDYFLPAQMCHMRVNEKYRVWHGWCHLDDARMAPLDSNHFDGYIQGAETLTNFKPGEHVPMLNRGGWHDAGDYDMRVESQAETIYGLTLAYEQFAEKHDNTSIDQKTLVTEIHQPDNKPDILEQIEHGLLSVTASYRSMGRFYRGIIEPTIRQYVLLGDPANLTDNIDYDSSKKQGESFQSNIPDDRWVFTEKNPRRELETAASLAASSRVMKGYNDTLSKSCIEIAQAIWEQNTANDLLERTHLASELLLTTHERKYANYLINKLATITSKINQTGWYIGLSMAAVNDKNYSAAIKKAVQTMFANIQKQGLLTPYGVPYEPNIWGAGWTIQNFGARQYFLHVSFPDIVSDRYMLDALNFILGVHPGSNTSSFVSGVGSRSMTTAYGFNRADWSYIPGGISSGTALIRPDFPELLDWPYLWQQGEYVLGYGTTDFLILAMAADHLLNSK